MDSFQKKIHFNWLTRFILFFYILIKCSDTVYRSCYGKKHDSKIQVIRFFEFSCKMNINFVKILLNENLYIQQTILLKILAYQNNFLFEHLKKLKKNGCIQHV